MAASDLTIRQGATFVRTLRWETPPIVYKAIAGVPSLAPLRLTVPAHGVPNGWRVAISGVRGMAQLNAQNMPPKPADYRVATVVDADTIELNEVNGVDFKPYQGGGVIQFNSPASLVGYQARLAVKDKVGGSELLRLNTGANGGIEIDDAAKTIVITLDAAVTAALTWKKGVFDLELVSPDGVVTPLVSGVITVSLEVTT